MASSSHIRQEDRTGDAEVNAAELYHGRGLMVRHVQQYDHPPPPSSPSSPLPDHPSNFNFPTLNLDGSLPEISAPTPPAALSSLGARAKMEQHGDMGEIVDPLADSQYDMLDDLSETSTDDHDTASITSHGRTTPDDAGSETGLDEPNPPDCDPMKASPSHALSFPGVQHQSGVPEQLRQQTQYENDLIDSYLSDDLDTPRQSTIPVVIAKGSRLSADLTSGDTSLIRSFGKNNTPLSLKSNKQARCGLRQVLLPYWQISISGLILLAFCIIPSLFTISPSGWVDRRKNLIEAAARASYPANITHQLNLTHLLYESDSTYALTPELNDNQPPHFQGLVPNFLIVSLPSVGRFPEVTQTRVLNMNGKLVAFDQRQLIEGIYMITFDPAQARGNVTVHMLTKKPYKNVTAYHDYGMTKLQSYQKASSDMGKAICKDVAVMREAAKNLTDKLATELGAGMRATKNTATYLASLLTNVAMLSEYTASTLARDLLFDRLDMVRSGTDVPALIQSKVSIAKNNSKALIRSPLMRSRERLLGLKKALFQKKLDVLLSAVMKQSLPRNEMSEENKMTENSRPVRSNFESTTCKCEGEAQMQGENTMSKCRSKENPMAAIPG